jgi:hypothetical protein
MHVHFFALPFVFRDLATKFVGIPQNGTLASVVSSAGPKTQRVEQRLAGVDWKQGDAVR